MCIAGGTSIWPTGWPSSAEWAWLEGDTGAKDPPIPAAAGETVLSDDRLEPRGSGLHYIYIGGGIIYMYGVILYIYIDGAAGETVLMPNDDTHTS